MPPEWLWAAAGVIVALALVVALSRPRRSPRRRLSAVIAAQEGVDRRAGPADTRSRRREIEEALREIDRKQAQKRRDAGAVTLSRRLRQAGLGWSRSGYLAACAGCAAAGFLVALAALDGDPTVAAGFGAASGLALPHLYVARRRSKRLHAVIGEFPDALEMVVRGVRAGLPLGDCLRSIASEGREPLRTEMRQFVEDMAIGLSLEEAAARMADRLPMLEIKMFGVILSIQNRAGGNLSEALGNLAAVLRERKKLRARVRAISSEAVSSAAIIGALPVAVCGLLAWAAPDYVTLLFTTQIGQIMVAISAVWMTIGMLVMRKMIHFDF